jgi:tetratricopeptide (TPR) repeat protein
VQQATASFDAYNFYLLGRHHFHKRTAPTLQRAVEYFEQAIASDPDYALAYSGLADAYMLLSAGYYGDMSADLAISHALPAAQRALELAPELAEAHTSMGLIRHSQGEFPAAEQAFERAIELNPAYTTAHVWRGLVFTAQGRYREAAASNREAFRLDPLSPIVNTNAGFDSLRFGDEADARARFAAAMEIDPEFPVPYSGMARLHALRGALHEARRWIEQAIEHAPMRSFYLARKGLFLLQLGETPAAVAIIDEACCTSSENKFDADLVIAMHLVRDDAASLGSIADRTCSRFYTVHQRAQAQIALGNFAAARALYEQSPPDAAREIRDVVNDEWIWRLPHVVNYAHLRLVLGDEGARRDLERLLEQLHDLWGQGVVNVETLYWAGSAELVLGREEAALRYFEDAVRRGWRHAWWASRDWNLTALAGNAHFAQVLEQGARSTDA